jgi:hypothetical protein
MLFAAQGREAVDMLGETLAAGVPDQELRLLLEAALITAARGNAEMGGSRTPICEAWPMQRSTTPMAGA